MQLGLAQHNTSHFNDIAQENIVLVNPTFMTLTEQADAIRSQQISAVELFDAHFAHIDQHNSKLNAIVTFDEERARARAREADVVQSRGESWGPLHGVTVTIKDAIATEAIRTTGGYMPLTDYVPAEDAPVVARLKAAGAIVIGKTNLPELSRDFQCENPIFGRSNNPWDLKRTPGGSTGGGAAAVAAGLSPLEIGSDLAGSVRIPAHYSGIYSLKPTEHRVPTTGHIPELPEYQRSIRHMNTIGPLARSIEDLTLALHLIAGPDGHDPDVPPVPLSHVPTPNLTDLRLAWADSFSGVSATADTQRGLRQLASDLAEAGVQIEQCLPDDLDFPLISQEFRLLMQAETYAGMSDEQRRRHVAHVGFDLDRLDPESERGLERQIIWALEASVRDLTQILNNRDAQVRVLERFFASFDALLCPVSATPAIEHCPRNSVIQADDLELSYFDAGVAFTMPFNLTGHPVVTVPLTQSADGLPIGMQIIGSRWGEMKILAIARALEPFIQGYRRPPSF